MSLATWALDRWGRMGFFGCSAFASEALSSVLAALQRLRRLPHDWTHLQFPPHIMPPLFACLGAQVRWTGVLFWLVSYVVRWPTQCSATTEPLHAAYCCLSALASPSCRLLLPVSTCMQVSASRARGLAKAKARVPQTSIHHAVCSGYLQVLVVYGQAGAWHTYLIQGRIN